MKHAVAARIESLYSYIYNDGSFRKVIEVLVRHLSYFVTLAREGHFARAAECCNISQPTLSAAIRKLEGDLDVRLVVRKHRFVGLTREGEKTLSWARQILADYNSLRDDLAEQPRGLSGILRLGVIPSAVPAASSITAPFAFRHPDATIDVRSMTSREIHSALEDFEIDGGITYLEDPLLGEVIRVPLYEERYLVAVHRSHPFAGRNSIDWSELASCRLCLLGAEMQNRRIVDRLAADAGVAIRPEVVTNSLLGIWSYLQRADWVSIVPQTFFHTAGQGSGIVGVGLSGVERRHSVGLVLSNRDPSSPMADALFASMRQAHFDFDHIEGVID